MKSSRQCHCIVELTDSLDEVKEHWNNYVFTVQTADISGNTSRPPLLIRYIDERSIVVPGMSGLFSFTPRYIRSLLIITPDSHAHILEYGASRIMDLEGAKTIQGADYVGANIPTS